MVVSTFLVGIMKETLLSKFMIHWPNGSSRYLWGHDGAALMELFDQGIVILSKGNIIGCSPRSW